MTGELYINGIDAYSYGVSVAKGFNAALRSPRGFKDDIETDNALEHGKRLILSPYYDSRDISLSFVIKGENRAVFKANEAKFREILDGRKLTVKVSGDDNYYRLVYFGKSTSYGYSPTGVICTITAKFTEVNPSNRGETNTSSLFEI